MITTGYLWLLIIILTLFIVGFWIVRVGIQHNEVNWGHPVTNFLDGWLRFYCKKYHRLGEQKIELPTNQNLILAANHISAIDPFLLIAAIDRPVRFMIAKEEYDKPILNRMFKAAGCIPVDRGGRVEKAFRSAMRAINAGELVAMFPQGGIHSELTPRDKIKPGIVRLSQLTNSQIIPVRIRGVSAPGTMVACLFKRGHVQLDIAEPITAEQISADNFKQQFADWLLERSAELFPSHQRSDSIETVKS